MSDMNTYNGVRGQINHASKRLHPYRQPPHPYRQPPSLVNPNQNPIHPLSSSSNNGYPQSYAPTLTHFSHPPVPYPPVPNPAPYPAPYLAPYPVSNHTYDPNRGPMFYGGLPFGQQSSLPHHYGHGHGHSDYTQQQHQPSANNGNNSNNSYSPSTDHLAIIPINSINENSGNKESAMDEDSISEEDDTILCEECDTSPSHGKFKQTCPECLWTQEEEKELCGYCLIMEECIKCHKTILDKMKLFPTLDIGNDRDLKDDIGQEYRYIAQHYIDNQQKVALVGAQITISLKAHQIPDSLVMTVISFLF